MAGWLPGFRSSTSESTDPQPFELICECNVRHSGLRRKSHQRIVCRTCGASLFVLPRDAYPPPPDAERIKKKRSPKKAEPQPDDAAPARVSRHKRRRAEQEEVSSPLASAASLSSAAFNSVVGTAGRATRSAVSKTSRAGADLATGVWRFWTPLRLAALGIAVLLTAFVFWSRYTARIERAEQDLNPAIEEGLAALTDGDLAKAVERLDVAAAALDLLGQHDRHAESVRAAHREAVALRSMSNESLLTLLEQADESVEQAAKRRPKSSPDDSGDEPPPLDADWTVRFEAIYRSGWMVLEAPVRRLAPTETEPRRYEVGFPVGIGPKLRPVAIRADFEAFDHLQLGDTERTVVFGGRLAGCRFDEARQQWRVTFDPSTGFVWVNPVTYRRLGFLFHEWHPQEQTEQMLSQQADALDVDALVVAAPSEAPALAPQ